MKSLLVAVALCALVGCKGSSSSDKPADKSAPSNSSPTNSTGSPKPADTQPSGASSAVDGPAAQASAKPVNTMCPIQGDAIDPTVTTIYNGKVIGFCCESCIPKFQKDPEKYVKNMK